MPKVYLLDYVAGNVRSLVNAIEKVGYSVEWIRSPEDVEKADVSGNHELGGQNRSLFFYLSP
jgi:imidazoleglycerol phosphate synthase glutamine amidotransferase subunit HisH